MRIAILTQPLHINYGGLLQNYALQTALKKIGHEPVTLDPTPYVHTDWTFPLRVIKRVIWKFIFHQHTGGLFWEYKKNRRIRLIETNTEVFMKKNICFKRYRNITEIDLSAFDAFIVGSDQVWRPKYNRGRLDEMFLDFTKGIKVRRIAYAASFGTDVWEYTEEETTNCKELIKLFHSVSVREKSGISLCRDYLGKDTCCLLDPTLLLEKEDYLKLVDSKPSEGNLMVYVLDKNEDMDRLVNIVVESRHLKPFFPNVRKGSNYPVPPVEDWIKGFRDAEFVITDSFHGCLFSIIFNKPFVVIGNKERGYSRFENILSMLHLEDRLILFSFQFHQQLFNPFQPSVYKIIENMKVKSYAFLKQSLSTFNN